MTDGSSDKPANAPGGQNPESEAPASPDRPAAEPSAPDQATAPATPPAAPAAEVCGGRCAAAGEASRRRVRAQARAARSARRAHRSGATRRRCRAAVHFGRAARRSRCHRPGCLLGWRLDDHRAGPASARCRPVPEGIAGRGVRFLFRRDGQRLADQVPTLRRDLLSLLDPSSSPHQDQGESGGGRPRSVGDRSLAGGELARARGVPISSASISPAIPIAVAF